MVYFKQDIIVFYSDLVESTRTVHKLSDEELAEYYPLFLNEMTSIIYDFGGSVLKFVGDCVIGFYIMPKAGWITQIDNSILCVQMMQTIMNTSIKQKTKEVELPEISSRIGIDCGAIQVIKVGIEDKYIQYDFFGDVMNRTKKVCDKGGSNDIIVGDNYRSLLYIDHKMRCQKIEPLKINDQEYDIFKYIY